MKFLLFLIFIPFTNKFVFFHDGCSKYVVNLKDYSDWYISANAGMGACLVMAEEMHGYILSDKATFLTFQKNSGVMD